jgi:DNA-3-methyladenine glycosylase II
VKSVTTASSLTPDTLLIGVRALSAADRDLARVVNQYGPPPMWGRSPGFATLLRIILEQQVSLASADAAYRRLRARVGRVTPAAFLELNDRALRQAGFSRQKTLYGRELARAFRDGNVKTRELKRMGDQEVAANLTRIKGIGEWTVNIYLLMALRRPDVWPPGDLALAKAARELKGLKDIPNDEELVSMSEAWRPWRAVAARILWHYYLSVRQLD